MATAYGTLTDADQYFTDRGGIDVYPAWFGATTAEKQIAHVLGTDYVDDVYEPRMQGSRAVSGQERAFPRLGVVADGHTIDSTTTPEQAKRASWEAALRHLKGDSLLPDAEDRSTAGEVASETKRAGPVSKSVTYEPYTRTNLRTFRRIDALMRPLLIGGSGSVPVVLVS